MPREVTTGQYAFDPLMQNPDNRVVNEKQVLVVPDRDDYHFLIPQAAPFFVSDVTVRNETTGETYYEGTDYVFGHWFVEATSRTGRSIAGSIRFLRRNISGIIVLDYHTLGGQWGFDDQAVLRELSQRSLNPVVRAWAQIDVLPAAFPPVAHDQDVSDLIGFEDIVQSIDRIVEAIDAAREGSTSTHILDRNNPHDVTKTQVGLGLVENFPVATLSEAQQGFRNDRYMTPERVRNAIEEIGLGALSDHTANLNNPHQVTKAQVGLGSVLNYGVASISEAQQRQVANKYMTPERTGDAIEHWFLTTIAGYFDGTVENATNVTKQQIGLGAVENFPMATDTEAVDGTRNDRYMSPLRSYQLTDRFAIVPLNNHKNDYNNPHRVTKAQVGLSNVVNFGIATEQQAREGLDTQSYMTPYLVSLAITNNAGTDLGNHLNDFDNPHNVSKTQVGLGSVQNYGIATKQEAEEGLSNEVYMTSLRVKEAVTHQIGVDFNNHINDDTNPHGVTKAQVGLSNVQNYSVATEQEAVGKTRTDRYITPALLDPVLDQFLTDLLALLTDSETSPIEITKDQVGLGLVENYAPATIQQAQDGSATDAYMTASLTKAAIDAQVRSLIEDHINDRDNPHELTAGSFNAYTITEVDNLLSGKLSVNGTASNANQVYNLSKSALFSEIQALKVNDSTLFDGRTFADLEDIISGASVENARTLEGETKQQIGDSIYARVQADVLSNQPPAVIVYHIDVPSNNDTISAFDVSFSRNAENQLESTSITVIVSINGYSYPINISGTPGNMHAVTLANIDIGSVINVAFSSDETDVVRVWMKNTGVSKDVIVVVNDDINSVSTIDTPVVDNTNVFDTIDSPLYTNTQALAALEQAFQEAADELQA